MANIAIIDTGYLDKDTSTGTQATMANSGSAINLKGIEITFQGGRNVDDSPIINSNSECSISMGSISNAKITVTGVMLRDNTSDMTLLAAIDDLRKTYGIKLLYYTDASDGYREITDSIGATDSVHLSGTIPHIHVQVTNVSITQTANSKLVRYTIEMMETI